MSDQVPDQPSRDVRHRPTGNGPRKWNRGTLIVAGTLTVAVAVSVGLIITGSRGGGTTLTGDAKAPADAPLTSSSSSSSAASAQASSAASQASQASQASSAPSHGSTAAAPWSSSTNCPSQLASWRSTGAGGQLQVVSTFINIATQAAASLSADLGTGTVPAAAPPSAPAAEVSALRSAATSLGSSTQAATKNLIPGCLTDAAPAEVKGLTDLNAAVTGFGKVVTGAGSGDYGAAQRDMQTAIAALQSGSAEMTTAIVALNKYGTK